MTIKKPKYAEEITCDFDKIIRSKMRNIVRIAYQHGKTFSKSYRKKNL